MDMSNIAFIGLGVMGHSMAGHLLANKRSLTLHTRTKSKAEELIKRGATWAVTPAAAAKDAEVIFLCLPDTPDVESVVLGKKGLIESARPGTIIVDHSTISPSGTRKISDELAKKKISFLDAPISGGDVGARNATLAIMCGGDKKTFDKVLPLLRVMGKTITHCGGVGAGQLTKLVNQILVSVTNMAVCEALTFALKNKLDLPKTIEAVGGGAASSWQLLNLGPRMIAGDMRPGFSIDLQQKDLRLVQEAAEFSKTSLPATSLVHQLFTAAQAAGHGKDGTQALFTVVEKLASLH
jgi:3-hydroxyisobutyrate dehydrogenase